MFTIRTFCKKKSFYFLQQITSRNNFFPNKYFSSAQDPKKENPKESPASSKYKEAFADLKTKLHSQPPPEDDKMSPKDDFNQIKDDLYRNYKYNEEPIDPSKSAEQQAAEEARKSEENKKSDAKESKAAKAENKENKMADAGEKEKSKEAEEKKGIKEKIADTAPFLGKVADFVADSWEQTFPSDKYQQKREVEKRKAKDRAEQQKNQKEYTEEELEKIQEEIPEHRRTALEQYEGAIEEEDVSLRKKVSKKIKEKFDQTDLAKKLYQREEYKDYEEFKKEMSQFKEDLKDHLSQSQNPAVIASVAVFNKATSESNTAQAIKEMRKTIKNFDVFDLEKDAKGIFCDAFNAYLEGDLEYIDKSCEDVAKAYFKTLLKKREIDGVYPKYPHLWEAEPADFIGGRISETNRPCFTFTIRIQEIHCNISKKTEKIVDGADDRVLQNRYNFVLAPHDNPDVEVLGHQWVILEVVPIEAVHMLA